MHRTTVALHVLLMFFACASACSLVAVGRVPRNARTPATDHANCNDSYAAPIADTVLATALATTATALAVSAATYEEPECCSGFGGGWSFRPMGGPAALLSAVPALAHGASAIHGYVNVGRCRDLIERRSDDE